MAARHPADVRPHQPHRRPRTGPRRNRRDAARLPARLSRSGRTGVHDQLPQVILHPAAATGTAARLSRSTRPPKPVAMSNPFNVTASVLGQPWRWRASRPMRATGCGRRSRHPAAARARRAARRARPAPGAAESAASCPTRRSSATWTAPPTASPMRSSAREKVAMFGDYDVDGATSAALLIRCCASSGSRRGPTSPTG